MELTLPQDISFDCPTGTHPGNFYDARPIPNGNGGLVRLLFAADNLSNENKLVLVGRTFPPNLHRNGKLRVFLDTWLGFEFVEENSNAGRFDFKSLEGKKGMMAGR